MDCSINNLWKSVKSHRILMIGKGLMSYSHGYEGRGLYLKENKPSNMSEILIGFSVFTLSFLYLPIFLYHRYKGKDLTKYTLDYKKLKKKE